MHLIRSRTVPIMYNSLLCVCVCVRVWSCDKQANKRKLQETIKRQWTLDMYARSITTINAITQLLLPFVWEKERLWDRFVFL